MAICGLLLLSACGGGGASAKSAYIAKANAVCQSARSETAPLIAQVTSLAGSLGSPSTRIMEGLASKLRRLHTAAAEYLAQLRRLKQPPSGHSAIQKFLTPLAHIVDAIGKAATAVDSRQAPTALSLLERAVPTAHDVTAAAHAYGMRECETVLSALA